MGMGQEFQKDGEADMSKLPMDVIQNEPQVVHLKKKYDRGIR